MAGLLINSMDHCKGMLAQILIAPWVSGGAGGNPTYADIGEQQALDFVYKATSKKITPGNRMWATDKFVTGEEITGTFEMLQSDLRNLAVAGGRLRDSTGATSGDPYPVVNNVASTGTSVLALGEPFTQKYWRMMIVIRGQNMQPWTTSAGGTLVTYPYVARAFTLWRVVLTPNVNVKIDKGDNFAYKVDWEPVEDSTVSVQSTTNADETIGIVTDYVTAPA